MLRKVYLHIHTKYVLVREGLSIDHGGVVKDTVFPEIDTAVWAGFKIGDFVKEKFGGGGGLL